MLKKIIALTIVALFLLQIGNYFPIFKIKQWAIRRQIERVINDASSNEALNNDALKHIAIPTNYPLKWERDGREFWFEGQLYDVVRSETTDSLTHYYCINDVKETDLCVQFDQICQKNLKNGAGTEGSPLANFFKKISKIYFPPTDYFSNDYVELGALKHLKTPIPYRCFYTSLSVNLIDPPPKDLV